MADRAANEALKGYFYQFDQSIIQILNMSDASVCAIEGVEDIDLSQPGGIVAIQCKYHEGKEYQHSAIKKPIQLMFIDFCNRKASEQPSISYLLYGHFGSGQEKLKIPVDLACLKANFLTYKEKGVRHVMYEERSISDVELQDFCGLLSVDLDAEAYDAQHRLVLNLLKEAMSCSEFEAEHYYYNNALNLVRELAIKSNVEERKITRKSFLTQINKKELLFGKWFLQLKTEESYIKAVKNEYFTCLNLVNKNRFFLIESSCVSGRSDIKSLVELISEKYSKLSRRENDPFCPYIYFHGLKDDELLTLKDDLYAEGFGFIDGHPYKNCDFKQKSIHMQPTSLNGIKIKLIDDLECLKLALESSERSTEIVQFFSNETFFDETDSRIMHLKIQVTNLQMIRRMV